MDLLTLIAQLIAFALAFLAVIFLVAIANFLAPKKEKQNRSEEGHVVREKIPITPPMRKKHLYEKYDPMITFEILYWRGVEEPWRWNSYTRDLVKYAEEHLPHKNLEFSMYNTSRQDTEYRTHKNRIEQLRLKKIRRFPLVVFSYLHGEEFVSVDSSYKYQYVIDRIDAEWDRYYGLV